MKKRSCFLLVFLLTLFLVLICSVSVAFAADEVASGTCGAEGDNLKWVLTDDGTLTISGEGKMADYPDTPEIASPWYGWRYKIKNIVIDDGVKSVGVKAFYGLPYVEKIDLGTTVEELWNVSIAACDNLKQISLSPALKGIYSAIWQCPALERIDIIDLEAFINIYVCEDPTNPSMGVLQNADLYLNGSIVKELVIPDSITKVGSAPFFMCRSIESVVFHKNVTELGRSAFEGCENLKNIYFKGNIPTILGNGPLDGDPYRFVFNYISNSIELYYPDDVKLNFEHNYYGSNLHWIPDHLHTPMLSIRDIDSKDIVLDWTAPMNSPDHYELYRKTAESEWAEIESYNKNENTYEDFLLTPDTDYYYKVYCYWKTRDGLIRTESNIVSVRTLSDTINPEFANRVFGDNRYETAIKAADELKKVLQIEKFEKIIVGSGSDYPDALSAGFLSDMCKAPILLINNANEDAVKKYIRENLSIGGTVYILGGTNAVSQRFEDSIRELKICGIDRLGGADRYETNLKILEHLPKSKENLVICSGKNYADALSASALEMQLMIVGDSLTKVQMEFLDQKQIANIYIIGGINAVSKKVENQLEKYTDYMIVRISGADRYQTSLAVAESFFDMNRESAILVYGQNFPDGLSAAPIALAYEEPIILASKNKTVISRIEKYADKRGIKKAIVFGGPGLISDANVNKIIQ